MVNLSWDGAPIRIEDRGRREVEVPALGEFNLLSVEPVAGETRHVLLRFSDALARDQNLQGLVRIEDRPLTFEIDGNLVRVYSTRNFLGTVDVLIGQGLPESFIVDAYLTLNLKLTARQHEQVMREGIVVGQSITLRAGAHRISVAARDLPSGATGSVFIPADRARAPTGRE